MRARTFCVPAAGILAAMLLSFPVAHAQLGDLLKNAGSGSSGGLGNLGGMLSGQSTTSGSLGNVAGLLEFCVKNNYLNGSGASSVKDSLMSKLSGKPSSDSGYTDGAKGILNSSNGKQLDLSGGGLKQQVTKQICDKVLAQGKSML
ncbi:MAG TPA: DUF2501 domain-containing protein [Burkholderiales bacterium]|nr:DUF2501 domain-containing protein [Burkholderiales bacterium]